MNSSCVRFYWMWVLIFFSLEASLLFADDRGQVEPEEGLCDMSGPNFLTNPSFEQGLAGDCYGITGWTGWDQWGGSVINIGAEAYHGTNVYSANTVGGAWTPGIFQNASAVPGAYYKAVCYMKTPVGGAKFAPVNGLILMSMEFRNSGGSVIGSSSESRHFDKDFLPTNWTRFETPMALAPVGTANARVIIVYVGNNDASAPNQRVYVDAVGVYTAAVTRSGSLWNTDFDYVNPANLAMTAIPYWTRADGVAGGAARDYVKTGGCSLAIWNYETLLGQTWSPTPGYRYESGGYILVPTNKPFPSTNVYAAILQQYYDAAGAKIAEAVSAHVTYGDPTGSWIKVTASGVAPQAAATGLTYIAILGYDAAFDDVAYFDDLSHSILSTGSAPSGLLHNPGFEDGSLGNAAYLSNDLPRWTWLGGTNAGFVADAFACSNYQSLAIVYHNNMAVQTFAAQTGASYVASGCLYSPAGSHLTSTSAYATLLLEFFSSDGGAAASVSTVKSALFTQNSPTGSWVYFSVTNHAPWTGNWVTGRVACALLDSTGSQTMSGAVYFDNLSVVPTNLVWPANTQAGRLWNPGFEYTANGTKLAYIDNWSALGQEGLVDDELARSGAQALKLYAPETLLAQEFSVTPEYGYIVTGYVASVSGPGRFVGSTNALAVLVLEFYDASAHLLASSDSEPFWATNYTPDTWTRLVAAGTAPAQATYARVLCALVGQDDAFGGAVWFDDLGVSEIPHSGPTHSGFLDNPGFEDGPSGDLYNLKVAGQLPIWQWLGTNNSGFIVNDVAETGVQSLCLVYPGNLLSQDFPAQTGMYYVAQGSMRTPSINGITNGSLYGAIVLEFITDKGEVWAPSISAVKAGPIDNESPKDAWLHFSVTNRSPWDAAWVTGRVSCALLCADGNMSAAQVFFDNISVTSTVRAAMTNTQTHLLWNPGFEYTAVGAYLPYVDSWHGFGAAGQVDDGFSYSGRHSLKIFAADNLLYQDWPATQGYKYRADGFVMTPQDERFSGSNAQAVVLLQFLNRTGGVLHTYSSDPFTPDHSADAWTQLFVRGVAPMGSVTGRTLCGIVGSDNSLSGAVWFDHFDQDCVATSPSLSGLLINPGLDDNPTGDAYAMNATGDLHGWEWAGGPSVGFITRSHKLDGDQSFVLGYPRNYLMQHFTAAPGSVYRASGYLFTPADNSFYGDGLNFGQLQLQFYVDGNSDPAVIYKSPVFDENNPVDQWTPFEVIGEAPAGAIVTGALVCAIVSKGNEELLSGVIHFDEMSVFSLGQPDDSFVAWQWRHFGATNGTGTAAQDDYDNDQFDNRAEFIAGTQPTNEHSVFVFSCSRDNSAHPVVLRWSSLAQRYYTISYSTNLMAAGPFAVLQENIPARPSENVYTSSLPGDLRQSFFRIQVSTNQP
ncbi:MAG TPA: hypothetical protein DCZ95_17660 [Verrucomicrobia bacterium]|nr:MAG: hypothetical protein A2X46_12905 [Lentisphaerae bacterium GWF2_57_35]HBA85914.1 hypothetical protein [Verrucomicrobiota bacterium]